MIPVRYVLAFWIYWGTFIVYALRVNMSVTIVAMVSHTTLQKTEFISNDCPNLMANDSLKDGQKDGEFLWDEETQGSILAAFFYGYFLTHVPGGWLAEVIGGKWLLGGGILCTSIFTLLTPYAAQWNVGALILVRALAGFGEGVTFPSIYSLYSKWIPFQECSTLLSIVSTGSLIGTVVTLPVAALLCESNIGGGWPSVFYIFGILGCLWSLCWISFSYETPEEHPHISPEELQLILKYRHSSKCKRKIPWLALLTSCPVWALALTKFFTSWSFYVLLTELPTYMRSILHLSMEKNGFENSALYLILGIFSIFSGFAADYLHSHKCASLSVIRKSFQTVGCFGPAVCFMIVPSMGCSSTGVLYVLLICMAIMGLLHGGESPVALDLAPEFAGIVTGLVNGIANLSGIFAPMYVGYITENNESIENWKCVFYTSAAMFILSAMVFLVFGSVKPEPWAVNNRHEGTEYTKNAKSSKCEKKILAVYEYR